VTRQVEAQIPALLSEGWLSQFQPPEHFSFKTIDPRPDYVKQIHKLVQFETIQSQMKIAVELVFGTGRGYLDSFWRSWSQSDRFSRRAKPSFWRPPARTEPGTYAEVSRCVRRGRPSWGWASMAMRTVLGL